MNLKLHRLPNRDAVKVTFTADADLKAALNDYAEVYRQAYGQKEPVAELIPFMLRAFMEADVGFKKARKQLAATGPESATSTKPGQTDGPKRSEASLLDRMASRV